MYMWLLRKFILLKEQKQKQKKKQNKKQKQKTIVFNLSNWNDNLKSVKSITHAILCIHLYTSEFELKSS